MRKAVAITLLLALPAPCLASEGELAISAGPTLAFAVTGPRRPMGLGGGADFRLGLNDEWSLAAGAQGARHAERDGTPSLDVGFVTVGATYAIDVLVLVPYARLDVAGYLLHPAAEGFSRVGVQGGFGVAWRRWRGWALAAELRYHAFAGALPEWPSYVTVQLSAAWVTEIF